MVSYEVSLGFIIITVILLAGSMNLQDIVTAQMHFDVLGKIPVPFIVIKLPLFFVFMTAIQAELTQPPFDMPVAESELVAGYQVEYSGFRFLTFFLAEFATAFGFAAVAATLFLGGWYLPLPIPMDSPAWYVLGPLILFAKIMVVAFIIFWVRFTYPRFREDQLQKAAWKYLIPLSIIWIAVTAVCVVVWK